MQDLPPERFPDSIPPPPPVEPPPPPRQVPWVHMLVGVVLIGGILLRWIRLDARSLSLAEAINAWLASLSIFELIAVLRQETALPLHALLLKPWLALFGNTEFVLRGFSALMATAALAVFYRLAGQILQRPAAVVAAMLLMALSVTQLEMAKEARPQALLALLLLIAFEAVRTFLLTRSRLSVGVFIFAAAAALYTHPMAALYIAAIDLAWLIMPGEAKFRRRLKNILLSNIAAALLFVPWMPVAMEQMRWATSHLIAAPLGRDELLTSIVEIGAANPQAADELVSLKIASWQVIRIFVIGLMGIGAILALPARPRMSVGLLVAVLLPLAAMQIIERFAAAAMVEPLSAPSAPLLILLLCLPLTWRYTAPAAWPVVALLALVSAVSVYALEQRAAKEDWRGVYGYVSAWPAERRLLIFLPSEGEVAFVYYARQKHAPPNWTDATGAPLDFHEAKPPQLLRRVESMQELLPLRRAIAHGRYDEIVLVLWRDELVDPRGHVLRFLRSEWGEPEIHDFNGVTLHRYTRSRRYQGH